MAVTFSKMAFLNRMAITFAVLVLVMSVITLLKPLPEPKVISKTSNIDLSTSGTVKIFGALVIIVTLALYVIFR